MNRPGDVCVKCGKPVSEVFLSRCPVCHRWACRRCEVRRHGKMFCSTHCADEFFFGEEET